MKKPLIIAVGGTCSNSGKTNLAVSLLKYLKESRRREQPAKTGRTYGRYCDNFGKWGAIKYTRTVLYASIVDDKAVLSQNDKDTGRFIDAGAEDVVWVKAPYKDLEEILPIALNRLYDLDGIIVEGNSVIEFLKPDIVIFIFGNNKELWKTGIEKHAGKADIIIYEKESELPEIAKSKRLFCGDAAGVKEVRGFFELISDLIYERKTDTGNNEKGY